MAPNLNVIPVTADVKPGIQPLNIDIEQDTSEICRFFNTRSIFLTGGTGFIGKALIEKLLRTCSNIDTIFILVRLKPDSDLSSRLNKLLTNPIFNKLRQNPELLQKIVPVQGDIALPHLGLSIEDKTKLCETVSIVVHAAATINFNEKLSKAIQINVKGTQELVQLCKQMSNFSALVHVSTAYANCNLSVIHEMVYPLATNPDNLLASLKGKSDSEIDLATPLLLENRPNTYTYTKAMAECVLEQESSIPIAIIRPSIVTGIWKEPESGWTDGAFGISGIPALWGKGVLRTMRVNGKNIVDFIPVDVVVNLIMASAWELGTSNSNSLRVYNCCSGDQNSVTWNDVRGIYNKCLIETPYYDAVWYPKFNYTSNIVHHRIKDTYQHYLPAVFMDFGCLLTGKKRRALKLYRRFTKFTNAVNHFLTSEFTFHTINTRQLHNKLSPGDKALFTLQIKELDWTCYLEDFAIGIRRHILKQDDATIPESRKQIRKLYWIRACTLCIFIFLILLFLICILIGSIKLI